MTRGPDKTTRKRPNITPAERKRRSETGKKWGPIVGASIRQAIREAA